MARPQKWPFLLIFGVISPKKQDLMQHPEKEAFKPAKCH
jgi:hypothetical protein